MREIRGEIVEIEDWRDLAECRDGKVDFFPIPTDDEAVNKALALCAVCDVVDYCLLFAIETNQSEGIWGGKVYDERKKYRRKWLTKQRHYSA